MAELKSTVVHGKLATSGKIYEMGQAIDEKFATNISTSGRYVYLENEDGSNIGGVTIPTGSISYSDTTITSLTVGSLNGSGKYPFTGSTTLSIEVQPGYMTNNDVNQPTVNVNYQITQSKFTYTYESNTSTHATSTATEATVTSGRKAQPGTNIIVSAGYYPNDRTIPVDTANVAGEISQGSTGTLSASHVLTNTSSVVKTSGSTGDYSFKIRGTAAVVNPGWVTTSDTAAQSDVTYYISKGTVTNNTSGGTSQATIPCGKQIKIGAGYYTGDLYYTAQTSAAGASGDVTITQQSGQSVAGKATATVQTGTAGAVSGGGLSQGTASGGGLTWSDTNINENGTTNNSGISVTVTRAAFSQTVSRAAASYSITKAGWISSAGAALTGDSSTVSLGQDSITKYVDGITLASGKTLATLVNNGTISSVTGTGTLTSDGSGTQTFRYASGSSANLNIKYTPTSGGSETTVSNVVSGGKLVTTQLPAYTTVTGSNSGAISSPTITLGANSITAADSIPSGTYLTLTIGNKTLSGNIALANAISAGWLSAVSSGTNVASYSTTATGYTKYIPLPAVSGTVGGSYGNLGTGTAVVSSSSNSAPSSGYYINVKYTPKYTVSQAGWKTSDEITGNVSNKWYTIQKGDISAFTNCSNLSVELSKTGSFVTQANTYGITSGTTPSTGTDGTNFLTLTLAGNNPATDAWTTIDVTEGYVTQSDISSNLSTEVSASLSGGTSYYIPIVTPAFTGGGVSSSISSWSQSNVTLSDTNNGISVTATPRASRTAVTWNGAKKGLINIANGATASSAVGNTNGTAGTKYISAITVPASKTLSSVTNNGTITTLAGTGTVSTQSGTQTIASNTGTINITANTGTVNYSNWTIMEGSSNNLIFIYNGS